MDFLGAPWRDAKYGNSDKFGRALIIQRENYVEDEACLVADIFLSNMVGLYRIMVT